MSLRCLVAAGAEADKGISLVMRVRAMEQEPTEFAELYESTRDDRRRPPAHSARNAAGGHPFSRRSGDQQMNDNDTLAVVRDSLTTAKDCLAGIHMDTPPDAIARTGRARCRWYRLTRFTGAWPAS